MAGGGCRGAGVGGPAPRDPLHTRGGFRRAATRRYCPPPCIPPTSSDGAPEDRWTTFGGYIADIPDLEACSAFGMTVQEAVAAVLRAKETWIEAARATGRSIPPPRYRPALYAS